MILEPLEPRVFLSGVPILHSNPAATVKVYLDFDGEPPTVWNGLNVPATPAYDTNHDPTTFSAQELSDIQVIWSRVADKFSPFNIDVTTANPGNFPHGVAEHIIIGGTGPWVSQGTAAFSYWNSFFDTSRDNSAYVFSGQGWTLWADGELAAHQIGYTFGLFNQQVWDSQGRLIYTPNPGNSVIAPISGTTLSSSRGVWWEGTVNFANNVQDDVALLASKFGYHPDAIGNTLGTATPSTSKVGVIEQLSDVDYFSFSTSGGTVTINVNASRYDATIYGQIGVMLDPKFQLFNSTGQVLATVDSGLNDTLTRSLVAGTYYVAVSGHAKTQMQDSSGNILGNAQDLGPYQYTVSRPAITATGDLNGDGILTLADVTLEGEYIVHLHGWPIPQSIVDIGDFSGNGALSGLDCSLAINQIQQAHASKVKHARIATILRPNWRL